MTQFPSFWYRNYRT